MPQTTTSITTTNLQTLTERETAAVLKCSSAALRRMRAERRGPRFARVGRLVRYPTAWLIEYIEKGE